ncbi:YeeE/YedE family protein [Aliivibrio sp. S3MY1]|uniref:YeeE/YedE family protein n=1 Tax=unclassified Aliivibrio TaxID=2645654 RepID=UPI0023788DB2|nr:MULTISPECIES: YeeE/YedE family protein [unclassified Aliivibrio]MDD9196115.1 YeeE/YedE family protein [Aliivibrio sp. S3MY1]MDD9199522.1 YeeE/YedE family protein [Aliivibrio sp. S2MY1]
MNNLLFRLVALISGLLFGLGMAISGMVDPAKVIGFLDVAGHWDPSLMFVMAGALLVFMPAYFLLIKPKTTPFNADQFCLSSNKKIDTKLLSGAAIFGIGWGMSGVCPGPAVSSLALGNNDVVIFIFAMMLGLGSTHFILNRNT